MTTDITRLTNGTIGKVTLADLVSEILHTEYDRPDRRRILANILRSHGAELREKIFTSLRCCDALDFLSDAEVECAVEEFLGAIES